jgi:cbb3-type cytochrome oxidase maturation protein
MNLIIAWALYALLGSAFLSAFFIWAVRARQFAEQDRARYLPLDTLEEEE